MLCNFWCNVSPSLTDVSPTENSWMLHPLDKVSLGYFAPDRTIPSLNSDFFYSFLNIILGGLYGRDWRYVGLGRVSFVGTQWAGGELPWMLYAIYAWCSPRLGHIGQAHKIHRTLCSRGATSKIFRSGTSTLHPIFLYRVPNIYEVQQIAPILSLTNVSKLSRGMGG